MPARLARAEATINRAYRTTEFLSGEFEGLLIYTCSLPCNLRGARLMDVLARFRKIPGTPAFRKGGGPSQREGLNQA
jgi:hypothetical protein